MHAIVSNHSTFNPLSKFTVFCSQLIACSGRRLEALKANDFEAYQEMLKEQQEVRLLCWFSLISLGCAALARLH